jgi:N-glycosylase/DNA lyase
MCRGLRLLRQDPWECLASFILSSSKQIVQIQEVVHTLRRRFGRPIAAANDCSPAFSFPSPDRLASVSEADLRSCQMGFRAPYLRETAHRIASRQVNLETMSSRTIDQARSELVSLPGVGRKIADCVLLFAYGFPTAFPIDVWVTRALQQLYFRGEQVPLPRLIEFTSGYFGPQAGYAQQYLFHYMRTTAGPFRRTARK